jgi:sugar transferase EpsL
MKRFVDIFIASLILIIFSPLMIMVSIIIFFYMGTPIIFMQLRPGLRGNPFYIYKFRTMIDKRDENGVMLPGKFRLTPFGKLLRKYSFDELPQLINVIKGDISLVGPRPLLMEYLHLYTPEQAKRHEVKPGITGWAQVNGRNAIRWEEKFALDNWYVENQSLWLDIKILALTVIKVFKKEGVGAKDHYSMEKFRGVTKKAE